MPDVSTCMSSVPRQKGRPTKATPDNLAKVFLLSRRGFTDDEMARIVGTTEETITQWKKRPDFSLPLKCNKKLADLIVERSLYERAIGYSHPAIHITNYEGDITETPYIKHYPPDVTAQIFWLKNRQPERWKDKHEVTGKDGESLATKVYNIINNGHAEKKTEPINRIGHVKVS